MKSWFWLFLYLHWGQAWQARWRTWRRRQHELAVDWRAFQREMEELDTPWRLAAWVDAHLLESRSARWLDPPNPPEATWASREGGPADFAALALHAMNVHRIPAHLVTVVVPPLGPGETLRTADFLNDPLAPMVTQQPELWHGHIVCAIRDEESDGWFHLSNWGMFGLYADMDEIAADISPRWSAYVIRDAALKVIRWRNRSDHR